MSQQNEKRKYFEYCCKRIKTSDLHYHFFQNNSCLGNVNISQKPQWSYQSSRISNLENPEYQIEWRQSKKVSIESQSHLCLKNMFQIRISCPCMYNRSSQFSNNISNTFNEHNTVKNNSPSVKSQFKSNLNWYRKTRIQNTNQMKHFRN